LIVAIRRIDLIRRLMPGCVLSHPAQVVNKLGLPEAAAIRGRHVGPAIAAIIVSLLRRRSLKEIGWKVGRMKWLVAGWVIPVAVSFAAYGLIWIAGLGTVPNPTFLQRARLTLGMTSQSNGLVIVAAFV